jgi:hypothetical protein
MYSESRQRHEQNTYQIRSTALSVEVPRSQVSQIPQTDRLYPLIVSVRDRVDSGIIV